MAIERDEPVYRRRGGARVGRSWFISGGHPWPTVKLAVWAERIELDLGWVGSVALARVELEVVRVSPWLFWTALRFEHASRRAPKYVRFTVWNADETIAVLTRLGYPIDSAR